MRRREGGRGERGRKVQEGKGKEGKGEDRKGLQNITEWREIEPQQHMYTTLPCFHVLQKLEGQILSALFSSQIEA